MVGASLDYAAEEAKALAHWSALALLPLLAKSLSSVPHQCALKLVAFPGREHGMHVGKPASGLRVARRNWKQGGKVDSRLESCRG